MKELVKAEQDLGGDGAKASESIVLEGGMIKARIEVVYPVALALKPVTDVIDNAITKLEEAIPGDWDKAVLEPIREAAKAELIKLLSE